LEKGLRAHPAGRENPRVQRDLREEARHAY
jgi:hypothetical protein